MKKLFVIALAAVGMVACVNDEIIETPQGNAISFDNAFIDNATRAELTAANLEEFKVWGYIDAENGQVAPLFEGTEVSNTTGDWAYSGGARYWAPGMKHYFQAIAPLTAAVEAVHDDGEVSAINYTVDGDSDLIYAAYDKVGAAAGSTNGPVSFTFDHLLSKVEFEFVNGFATEDGVTIAVKNVKMTVPAKGTYDIANEAWTVNTTVPAKTLENIEGSKFVLPYDNSYAYAIEFDVDVTYGGVVINKDVHKTSSVMVALNKGTAYKFTATINAETLNMESIDFEVGTVEGWITGGNSTLGTAYISTADALQAALNNPGVDTIVLTENIDLNAPLTVDAISRTRAAVEPVAITLDLKGKTITAYHDKSVGAVIKVAEGAAFNLKNGTVSSKGKNGGSPILNYGTTTLDNVTINGAEFEAPGWPSYGVNNYGKLTVNSAVVTTYHGAIATGGNGETVINNATIDVGNSTETNQTSWALYVYENGQLTVNGGTFSNTKDEKGEVYGGGYICTSSTKETIINGGTFDKTEGDNNGSGFYYKNTNLVIKGGTFDVNPETYLADGFHAVEKDGKYVVLPEGVDAVAGTTAELNSAIANGENVMLEADVTTGTDFNAETTSIDLNGNTLTMTSSDQKVKGDLTVKNGDVNVSKGYFDVRPSTAEGSVVVFEGVDFSYNQLNKTYGPSTNRLGSVVEVCATAAGANTEILFKKCTFDNAQVLFEGLSGTVGTFEATFEECTFNALTSSAPIYVQNYVEGTINVIDCTFNLECTSSTASAISVSSSNSTTVTVNAENNTINATAATPSGDNGTVEQVKVNGTPKDIKFISAYSNTTVNETNTTKTGIAK